MNNRCVPDWLAEVMVAGVLLGGLFGLASQHAEQAAMDPAGGSVSDSVPIGRFAWEVMRYEAANSARLAQNVLQVAAKRPTATWVTVGR